MFDDASFDYPSSNCTGKINKYFKLRCDHKLDMISWCLLGVLAVAILVGNSFTCVVFLSTERLRRSIVNKFLLSLAVCDILMALLVTPGYAAFCNTGCEYTLAKYCWFLQGGKDYAFLTSVFNLLAITYDRHVAVFQPLTYAVIMTPKKFLQILCLVWISPLTLALMKHTWHHNQNFTEDEKLKWDYSYNYVLLLTFVIIPITTVCIFNIRIVRAIRKQRRLKAPARIHSETSIKETQERNHRAEIILTNKGTLSCIIVTVIFVICWIPRGCYFCCYLFRRPDLVTPLLAKITVFFLFFQSSVNPIVYSFYRSEFREAAKKLLGL